MEKNLEKNSQTKKEKKIKKKRKNPFRFWFYDFVKVTAAIPTILFFRIKHIYQSKEAKKKVKKGALISANHTGFIDPVVVQTQFWYRRTHTVAMKELFETKGKNWFFRKVLCIPIDRQNMNISSFKDIISVLKDGKIVAIFPEGQINNDSGTVASFKSGVILMALKAKVPIVPIYIAKREKWYKRQVVVVGDPIQIDENCNLMQINQLSQTLHDKEVELMELYNQRRKKK